MRTIINGHTVSGNHAWTGREYRIDNTADKIPKVFSGQFAKARALRLAGELPMGDVVAELPQIGDPFPTGTEEIDVPVIVRNSAGQKMKATETRTVRKKPAKSKRKTKGQ